MSRRLIRITLAASAMLLAFAALPHTAAAISTGDQLSVVFQANNFSYGGPVGTIFAAPKTTIITANGAFLVDFFESAISLTVRENINFGDSTFNGMVITNNNPGFSFSTITQNTLSGFSQSDVSVTPTEVRLNFSLKSFSPGQSLTIGDASAVAVPEAGTFALALPALGMVGAVLIKRPKTAK
jgi:hypothetical protein